MSNETKQVPETGTAPVAPIPKCNTSTLMPSLLDREISSGDADAFGHRHFARALESLIESKTHKPPYSVGLLGKWGTGKSSIKSLYLEDLQGDRRRDGTGLIRSERVRTITFNAWRFGGENIRRALLRHVYIDLGGDESEIADKLFNQIQKPTTVPRTWKSILWEAYDKWLFALVQILALATALIALTWIAKWLFSLDDAWVITTILGIESLFAVGFAKYLLDPKRTTISRYSNITRVELPSVSAEQFEKLLIDQIVEFRAGHKKCERLVVFVDDLDRLSAEEMVGGLDAIRTFMEIPNEDTRVANLGIVFVISCDEDRIADALAKRRKDPDSDLPGVIFSRTDARRYLDRIFQFRLEIPPFPRQDMRTFAQDKFRAELPEIVEGIIRSGATLEEVVSRMIHVGVQSPRNALQIVNAFVESWWVASHREREGSGTESRGGLAEGTVTGQPLALAALSALRVDFPDFYNDLQREPELIARFLEVFVHKGPLANQPEGARLILEKYAVAEDPTDGSRRLKDGWRPLRQYLTSVESIPWPKSLQPLLLLSQDPLSRRMGDSALRIFDAFVSGDSQGVLADLGRDKDERAFDPAQMRWLSDLWEQVEQESDDRYDNAAAVLASLVGRLPQDHAGQLLVPLARRLASSVRLRMRVGVTKVAPILPYVTALDRRRVAGRFVEDLLLGSGEISFKLPSGETPNLDESIELCRSAAELALSVRSSDGLEKRDDDVLLSWLMSPRAAVGGKEYVFKFSEIEHWMNRHEAHVLADLGSNYLEVVVGALSVELDDQLDLDATAERIKKVLDSLWGRGEESREVAWDYVCRFVRVDSAAANEVAQEFFQRYGKQASGQVASLFVRLMAERVVRFISEEPLHTAEREALQLFTSTASARSDLDDQAAKLVGDVASKLGAYEGTGAEAANLVRALVPHYSGEATRVVSGWAVQPLTAVPEPCMDLAMEHYGTLLSDSARETLTESMTALVEAPTVGEEQGARYRRMVEFLPAAVFEDEFLTVHWAATLAKLQVSYSSPEYLRQILPAVHRIILLGPKGECSTMLKGLVANSVAYPEAFGYIVTEFLGKWPATGQLPGPYSPDNTLAVGQKFIETNPGNPVSVLVLESLLNMYEGGVFGEGADNSTLLANAVTLWPGHSGPAGEAMLRFAVAAPPEQAAQFATAVGPDDEAGSASLATVWSYYGRLYDASQYERVTEIILSEPQQILKGHPDGVLDLWCGLDFKRFYGHVLKALGQDAFTSNQKMRMWKQVEARISELGPEEVRNVAKLALLADPAVSRAVLDASGEIGGRFTSKSAQHDLAQDLMNVFPSALNLEAKNRIAEWIAQLGNLSVLNAVRVDHFNQEDIVILSERFPENKHLKKLLENRG